MINPLDSPKASTEAAESRLLVRYGFELARQLGINTVLVQAGLLQDRRLVEMHRENEKLIWVAHGDGKSSASGKADIQVEIPESKVDRMAQVTLGLIMAVLGGSVEVDESVVCLTGVAGSRRLDNLLIANPKRDFPWFAKNAITDGADLLRSKEFVRLVELALRFAAEGREGKPLGTIFVLGDPEELKRHVRPLILNPLKGHPRKARSIHDMGFVESFRELTSLDGAFIIDNRGVVERAGVYLDAPLSRTVEVEKGLGSRHMSAAALTAKVEAIAVVISESSGTVSVFSKGSKVMSLDARGGVR